LKPEDIGLENMVLHVRRSLQWSKVPGEEKGHWLERPPKQKSRRDLPIPATIKNAVVRHIARRQEEAAETKSWGDSGYLFVSVTGAPLHPRNVLTAFHELCDTAGVPRIRLHDCRHTCGTLLHAQGADPFVIQQVLGHTQLSTTRRYTHVDTAVTKPAITALESAWDAVEKQQQKEAQERAAAEAQAKQPQTTVIQ
jgi:integrase